MSDAHRPLQLRTADASPVLDFVQTQARSRLHLPLLLLTVLLAGVLVLQGGRWWAPTKGATVVPDKSLKILMAEKSGNMPAPVRDNGGAQQAVVQQAHAGRLDKPVVAAKSPPSGEVRRDIASHPERRRLTPHAPSQAKVAVAEIPVGHASTEELPASVERREPEPAVVMHEVTLRSQVRLTNGALN